MNRNVAGQKIVDAELVVDPARLEQLAAAVGTAGAARSALLMPFFAATAAGQSSVVGPIELDMTRALQGGLSFEWHRPFRPGETVRLQVEVLDVLEKPGSAVATLVGEFRAVDGELIQRQQVVFIERGAS